MGGGADRRTSRPAVDTYLAIMSRTRPTNEETADLLNEIAAVLEAQHANPHRVRAYRSAASAIAVLEESLSDIIDRGDGEALREIPGVGERLSNLIEGYVATGACPLLTRLEGRLAPHELFTTVPGIGEELAKRIADTLDIHSLQDLEVAAHDGRLANVDGMGPRRIASIKASLDSMLNQPARRRRIRRPPADRPQPPVDLLLDVDEEYREKAAANELRRIAPKRFNPEGKAWLPILHTERGDWHLTVLFSNTARAHELDKTDDWVVIFFDRDGDESQVTVVTETKGDLGGKRVVRGRESECREFYAQSVK
jgi:DNA polymerase (family 10)